VREEILPFLSIPAAAWLADTVGLSMAEQGFLFRALVTTWRTGPLPAEDAPLARAMGLTRPELRKLRPSLSGYFREDGNFLTCAWIEAEYKRARHSKERKREGALQTNAARAKRLAERSDSASLSESQSGSPSSSSSSSSTSIKPPESVRRLIKADPQATDQEIANCHVQHRVTAAQVAEIRRSMQ
jgi:uncharacterized protein YdaU (DUF1376 family)